MGQFQRALTRRMMSRSSTAKTTTASRARPCYPRNLAQAQSFDQVLREQGRALDAVVVLAVDDRDIIRRRLVDAVASQLVVWREAGAAEGAASAVLELVGCRGNDEWGERRWPVWEG